MMTAKKITKKDQFNAIAEIITAAEESGYSLPAGIDFTMLKDFIVHEVQLLDKKADSAAKRAAEKKVAGDALREKISSVLSDTEFKTIAEIVAEIDDPDVSPQMVTARLTQLSNLNQIEKDSVTIPASGEGGKSRKVSAYRKVQN